MWAIYFLICVRLLTACCFDILDAPYEVSVEINYQLCGAVILNKHFALSVVQCIPLNINPTKVTLRVGSNQFEYGGTIVPVAEILHHPQYDRNDALTYNMVLIKFKKPLKFTAKIQPVQLPDSDSLPKDGKRCHVIGWGRYSDYNQTLSEDVISSNVKLRNFDDCKKFNLGITTLSFCATSQLYEEDYGGPLICDDTFYGLVSYLSHPGQRGQPHPIYPGVYSKYSAYKEWIDKVMDDNVGFFWVK